MANNKCKECGCECKKCTSDHDVQLHVEIENLKQRLLERENHIVSMETNFLNEANKFPSGELLSLREELLIWQDKYRRLYDAHRRVQRVNQGLEDKLLKLVDACETDKNALTKDVAVLSHKLAEANYAIKKLTEDNDRYKQDLSLAIQFLQCKQSNFVAQKFDSLSPEIQTQVSGFMSNKKRTDERRTPPEVRSIKVPIPTFPPTAMVYSVPKSPKPDRKIEDIESPPVDIVSASIMAKVLEERQKDRVLAKHCDTCTCSKNLKIISDIAFHNIGTQTGEYKDTLCLRCNNNISLKAAGVSKLEENSLRLVLIPSRSVGRGRPVQNLKKKERLRESPDVKLMHNSYMKSNSEGFLEDISPKQINQIVQINPAVDNKSKTTSNNSSFLDLTSNSNNKSLKNDLSQPKQINPVNRKTKMHQDIMFFNVNEKTSPKIQNNDDFLCDKISSRHEINSPIERKDYEMNEDKFTAKTLYSENVKGPRYCSMRLQTGTKNILLDNTHKKVAPVLYTRSHKMKQEPTKSNEFCTESVSSNEKNCISISSDNSMQNQQRVAEWIQSNLDHNDETKEATCQGIFQGI